VANLAQSRLMNVAELLCMLVVEISDYVSVLMGIESRNTVGDVISEEALISF